MDVFATECVCRARELIDGSGKRRWTVSTETPPLSELLFQAQTLDASKFCPICMKRLQTYLAGKR